MPEDSSDEKSNQLTWLGRFITEYARTGLDTTIGTEIGLIGKIHDTAEPMCSVLHGLGDEPYPCEEWERGIVLGIAWLKNRIEELDAVRTIRQTGD